MSRYVVASYILSISTSTAILENLAIPQFDARNRQHQSIAACSQRLHEAAAAEQPLDELECQLDGLAAQLFGIAEHQLDEIRESYRELTKADLRDAREAEDAADADEETEGGSEGDGAGAVAAALDGNGEMTAAEVAAAAGMDAADLRPLLRQLIEAGRIEQTGRGRGTRYRLVEGGEV